MHQIHRRVPAARGARSFDRLAPPEKARAQGRPGARCTRGLVCKMHRKKTHTSIQVQRKHSGLPRAVVLRLISCSPWRPGFLATIAPRTNALAFARENRLLLKALDA